MKDNDIIKALKCCKEGNCDDGCPFYGVKEDCEAELPEEALNVINRQQAEIERYKGVIKLLENDMLTVKAKAVKEFAERFKKKYEKPFFYLGSYEQFMREVDNLVKEMAEQSTGYGLSKTEGNG